MLLWEAVKEAQTSGCECRSGEYRFRIDKFIKFTYGNEYGHPAIATPIDGWEKVDEKDRLYYYR
jgi:hypothetical protein